MGKRPTTEWREGMLYQYGNNQRIFLTNAYQPFSMQNGRIYQKEDQKVFVTITKPYYDADSKVYKGMPTPISDIRFIEMSRQSIMPNESDKLTSDYINSKIGSLQFPASFCEYYKELPYAHELGRAIRINSQFKKKLSILNITRLELIKRYVLHSKNKEADLANVLHNHLVYDPSSIETVLLRNIIAILHSTPIKQEWR